MIPAELSGGRGTLPADEALTVSGRTYAQADAADVDYYSTVVMTPGNRYHNDTWTAPA